MKKAIVYEGYYAIKELPEGELFKRKAEARKIYVKGKYDRGSKTYSVHEYEDYNAERFVKGSTKVWAGFTY